MNRRSFLQQAGLAAALPAVSFDFPSVTGTQKPHRLKPGDTIGLINPAGATFLRSDVEIVRESLAALGLSSVEGEHLLDRYGYLAGSDEARAADVMRFFQDDSVDGILAVRGGWGCARILPLLDYESIREHPKVLCGYSDITALIIAVYAKTGLVTFHGPDGISTWNPFSVDCFKRLLFDAEALTLENPPSATETLARTKDRIETIRPGIARGKLVGGNLSVLAGIVGSPYLPSWKGSILFVEEIGEEIYRVDRMLTQLKLAGILSELSGFIFGKCVDCGPGEGYGSLTLPEVLRDLILPLGVPAWYGAMIGHIEDKFTVPIGIEAEVDAGQGTIRLLEPAVT
jgi:muramoyltetrapeptide carboxypeptidase